MSQQELAARKKRRFVSTTDSRHNQPVAPNILERDFDRHLVLNALDMALKGRQPPRGLLHHSDRGSRYASADYQQALTARGLQCSMSRKGNCWDNAVVESFFSSLKLELVYTTDFATHEQARLALFEYIEVFYNRQRRHSSLGYVSPVDFELAALPQKLASQPYCPRNRGKPTL